MSSVREGLNSIAKKTKVKKTRKCVIQIKCEEHCTTFKGFLILEKTRHSVKKNLDKIPPHNGRFKCGLAIVGILVLQMIYVCLLVCFIILRKVRKKKHCQNKLCS